MGFDGYLSCASAPAPPSTRPNAASSITQSRFMWFSPRSDVPTRSGRLDALQSPRGVLAGEEHHVAVGGRLAGMHDVGRDVGDGPRLHVDFLAADVGAECAL